ncbi:hypothetical protein SAY86_011518 [Trapa natans]|uniref:Uncharacterized protein n=1 Tax=Trapa natans TaxID=22666 RepID=A0AAN7R4B1_TRANT|nr:hypothetical protein SAY86_011518 [Trapa natans]
MFSDCGNFLGSHLQSPRRNCCRVMDGKKKGSMVVDVGICNEEISHYPLDSHHGIETESNDGVQSLKINDIHSRFNRKRGLAVQEMGPTKHVLSKFRKNHGLLFQ